MILVYILLGCSFSQGVTVVYLLVRGRRLARRVKALHRRIDTRAVRVDELIRGHDEIRALFSGKAHADVRDAERAMSCGTGSGPRSSDI